MFDDMEWDMKTIVLLILIAVVVALVVDVLIRKEKSVVRTITNFGNDPGPNLFQKQAEEERVEDE